MTRTELIGNIIAEFAPIVTFLLVSEVFGFRHGLRALMIAVTISFLLSWLIERRIPKFSLIASGTILLFGIFSIKTDDPFYIIIKDTVYSGIFGGALLIGLLLKKNIFKTLFGDFFMITEKGWHTLVVRWIAFFFLLVIGNEIARRALSDEAWVIYKFCTLIVTWIFGFYQMTVTRRERLPDANPWGMRATKE